MQQADCSTLADDYSPGSQHDREAVDTLLHQYSSVAQYVTTTGSSKIMLFGMHKRNPDSRSCSNITNTMSPSLSMVLGYSENSVAPWRYRVKSDCSDLADERCIKLYL